MTIPETTSTEGLERFLGGKCLFHGRGEAWRDLKAWIVAQPPEGNTSPLPSVSEPFLAWTLSGEVDFQEREHHLPWITHRTERVALSHNGRCSLRCPLQAGDHENPDERD